MRADRVSVLCAGAGGCELAACAVNLEPGASAAAECCRMSGRVRFGDSTKGAAMVLLADIFAIQA